MRHYWILYYVIVACNLVSRPYSFVLRQIPVFIRRFLHVPFLMVHFIYLFFSYSLQFCSVLSYSIWWVRTLMSHPNHPSGGGSGLKLEIWMSARVSARFILVRNDYCAKPNPEPDAHPGYWVHIGLWDRPSWSTLEYELETTIAIRPLTQPVMCKMSSSIFAAMI